jgi:hypothetical protein
MQAGRYRPSLRVIIRPRRLCRDSAANGPQLQGVSAEDTSKAESLGADALQLGTISAFNWITCIQIEAARLDYYKAFLAVRLDLVISRPSPCQKLVPTRNWYTVVFQQLCPLPSCDLLAVHTHSACVLSHAVEGRGCIRVTPWPIQLYFGNSRK